MVGKKVSTAPKEEKSDNDVGQMEQLRQLVFGAAQAQIEASILALKNDTQQRFEQAQKNLSNEVKNLKQLIADTQNTLEDKLAHSQHETDEKFAEQDATDSKLATEIALVEANAKQENDELHSRLDAEIDKLSQHFTQLNVAAMDKLKQVTRELGSSKTDRKTLAKLLASVATNLETGDIE